MNEKIQKRVKWAESPFPELYEDTLKTPLCEFLAKGKHKSELILIHHLHEVAYPFIKSIAQGYKIRKIIGIPYSSVDSVVEKLGNTFDVVVPTQLDEIPIIVKQAVNSSNKPVIIEEIGGYTTDIAKFLDECKNVVGVVEDTHQGHWRWKNILLKRLAVLSVAYSDTKRIEDHPVAQSIIDGLTNYLYQNKLKQLKNQNVLVLGFGNIGEQLCRYIKPLCKKLSVYDVDPIRALKANVDYNVSRDFSNMDIIIGVTGKQSVTIDDANKLNPNTLLVSGSSKRIEFEQTLAGIVNNGEPINLRYSVVPSKILDLVYGNLIYCINKLDKGFSAQGLYNLNYKEQKEIAKQYKKIYKINHTKV
jgi:adenosylhomocysteinase